VEPRRAARMRWRRRHPWVMMLELQS